MGAAQADDAAVALHDALRVPGHIEGKDRLGLLQILALGEDVGAEQHVNFAVVGLKSGSSVTEMGQKRSSSRVRAFGSTWAPITTVHVRSANRSG